MPPEPPYNEKYRPQFHFTAHKNWLSDPNGCVFYQGEYHLFFQHNPFGREWGNMTWGHAVSPDLVHWQELPPAIRPYDGGMIYSGSAVVDSDNTSGLGKENTSPLIAAFTHAKKPFGQALAFSNDRGRAWQLYDNGKPVVPNQGLDAEEHDPKIFWHPPSRQWVMLIWVRMNQVRFFTSNNLREWKYASDFSGEGFYECPNLFELPVDDNNQNTRWILHDAFFKYWIGLFDGVSFTPESGPLQGDYGANFYAAQTWNNTGNRIIQISWMDKGQYPDMPFNQQMTFPCELSLRSTTCGLKLFRRPVREIECLYREECIIKNQELLAGQDLSLTTFGELFDIKAEIEISQDATFNHYFYDQVIACTKAQIQCLGITVPVRKSDGLIKLRLLVDRTSVELFVNDGEVSMSSCFLPCQKETDIKCQAKNGGVLVHSVSIYNLRSAWDRSQGIE